MHLYAGYRVGVGILYEDIIDNNHPKYDESLVGMVDCIIPACPDKPNDKNEYCTWSRIMFVKPNGEVKANIFVNFNWKRNGESGKLKRVRDYTSNAQKILFYGNYATDEYGMYI